MMLRDGVLEIDQTRAGGDSATSTVLQGFSIAIETILL